MRQLLIVLLFVLIPTVVFAGDVSLSWEPSPSENVAGYVVYYGNTAEELQYSRDVGDVLTADITDLAAGDWYFAVTAYSTDQESAYSNIVNTTFNPFEPPSNTHTPVTVVLPPGSTLQIVTPAQ